MHINNYLLEDHLGGGGGGIVRRVRDQNGDYYAMKICARNADRERFSREIEFLLKARSADINGIVRIEEHGVVTSFNSDAVEYFELPYIVMELAECGDLSKWLSSNRDLKFTTLMIMLENVFFALKWMHSTGMVHRDVKLSNILVRSSGCILSDFGIVRIPNSKLTEIGQPLGTPSFFSPEQQDGREADYRSDQFQMARVLCVCLGLGNVEDDWFISSSLRTSFSMALSENIEGRHECILIFLNSIKNALAKGNSEGLLCNLEHACNAKEFRVRDGLGVDFLAYDADTTFLLRLESELRKNSLFVDAREIAELLTTVNSIDPATLKAILRAHSDWLGQDSTIQLGNNSMHSK